MIRDNASTSTRIDWRRGGTITSSKLRETRSGHLESHLGLEFRGGHGGFGSRLSSEWREEEEGSLGLKGPDLGVESGHAEVWRLGVK